MHLRCRVETGSGVSSPRAAELGEIKLGVSHPDRQQEDSVSSQRHLPGTVEARVVSFLSPRAPQTRLLALEQGEVSRGSSGLYLPYLLLSTQPLSPSFCHTYLPTAWSGIQAPSWHPGLKDLRRQAIFQIAQNVLPGQT